MKTMTAMARTGLVVVALALLAPLLIAAAAVLYLFPTSERWLYTRDYRRLCFPTTRRSRAPVSSAGPPNRQKAPGDLAVPRAAPTRTLADLSRW